MPRVHEVHELSEGFGFEKMTKGQKMLLALMMMLFLFCSICLLLVVDHAGLSSYMPLFYVLLRIASQGLWGWCGRARMRA